ncbi:hypothetical protein [Streptomyces sp. NBC_01803]|uniref:hypothetical protein n=1 Tax=Streptomyces sp. NBC_01803 TaxID=2975946 RepID=UPI002DDC4B9A|nr:hypothetical protein [Streptomyces sp. NBC_01803]WSA44744.1 hypothetical protein OIE51_11335 [Streptomyces sp. NBC_01803]
MERHGAKFCAFRGAQIYLPSRRVAIPKAAAIARYEEGESLASLARSFQVSQTTVRRRFTEWGIDTRDAPEAAQVIRPVQRFNR